jgi:hypothetical protein
MSCEAQLVKLGCSDYRDSWRFHPPEKLREDDQDPVHTEQQKKMKEDLGAGFDISVLLLYLCLEEESCAVDVHA